MRSEEYFIVEISKDLPFEMSDNEVVYIEREHNEKLDLLMSSAKGIDGFMFIPAIAESLSKGEVMDYYNPAHKELNKRELYDVILNYITDEEEDITHGLLYYPGYYDDDTYYCLFINLSEEFTLAHLLPIIVDMRRNGYSIVKDKVWYVGYERFALGDSVDEDECNASQEVRYSVSLSSEDIENALKQKQKQAQRETARVDAESRRLMRELMGKVEKLEQKGISRGVIMYLIGNYGNSVSPDELSDILVTPKFEIKLPKYDIEVKMTPLIKTIYIFFLNHPHGVLLKNMPDHYDEILGIYRRITSFSDNEDIKNSIRRICDPLDNSINEKCSRIKQIFLNLFDERLAQYYYVTGGRGERKRIQLDKEKIILLIH